MREIIYNGDFKDDLKEKKKYKRIIPKVILGFIIWAIVEYNLYQFLRPLTLSSIPFRLTFMALTAGSVAGLIYVLNKINEKGLNAIKRLKKVEHEIKVDNKLIDLKDNTLTNAKLVDKSVSGSFYENGDALAEEVFEYEVEDDDLEKEYIEYIITTLTSPDGNTKETKKINVYNDADPKALKKIFK